LWGLGLPVASQQATVLARNPRVGIRGPGKRIRGEKGSTRNGNASPATSGIAWNGSLHVMPCCLTPSRLGSSSAPVRADLYERLCGERGRL